LLSKLAKTPKVDWLTVNAIAESAAGPVRSFLLASGVPCFVESFECLGCGEAGHE